MKKIAFIFLIICLVVYVLPFVSSAHYIVGYVKNASDGTSPNGKTIVLWKTSNGLVDNITDTIGPNGNSGANNIYFFDCELLNSPCVVGERVSVAVINNGDNYVSMGNATLNVTGAGFDVMGNLTLNSPPRYTNITVDDASSIPIGEIDLTPADNTTVRCEGVVRDDDGDLTLQGMTAELFEKNSSTLGASDDYNRHYTNTTCNLSYSYGTTNESYFTCSFGVQYYASSGSWNCTVQATDNSSLVKRISNSTTINTLLALGVNSPVDFGVVNATMVSSQIVINVTNFGNTRMNLSLSSYAVTHGDNLAMNCSLGSLKNISAGYMKFNLTTSNTSVLTLGEFQNRYKNITSTPTINLFNLAQRQNDTSAYIDDTNATYWRIYAPSTIAGTCSGNIVFGAVQGISS